MDDQEAVRFVVAHLFQRSGRASLSENELVNAMSLDLKWYPPKDARSLVVSLARGGHLRRTDDGELAPAHPVRDVRVPLGFRPAATLPRGVPEAAAPAPGDAPAPTEAETEAVAAPQAAGADAAPAAEADAPAPDEEAGEEPVLGRLLAALAERSGEDAATWVTRMDAVLQSSADCLTPEAALLLAAAGEGVDVRPWIQDARAALTA